MARTSIGWNMSVMSNTGSRAMNPIYDFEGEVALVTGAAKGMGLATAQMFAQSGASVVLADLDGDLAAKEAERIVGEGGTAIGIACDVAEEAQVAAMVDRTIAEYGRLDMAFNNAGIQVPPSDAADEPLAHFERVTAVNQRGVWACMKHELRVMREQGSGAIVNCSSLGGLVGLPQRAAYHGTKHAVLGMTKSAGVEYAPRGIRINAVCPGTIDTPMVADMLAGQADAMAEIMKQQSIGRLGRAEEVAAAVLWLCSPGASFVIGVGLPVDGGFTAH
jgi:NAD(P)-dependent dehydrogenase (short-subunit alcohol dehydrogenase family)